MIQPRLQTSTSLPKVHVNFKHDVMRAGAGQRTESPGSLLCFSLKTAPYMRVPRQYGVDTQR